MILKEEEHLLHGKKILLRSAREDDADMLLDYLKTIYGETPFLTGDPDEVRLTAEDEAAYIRRSVAAEDALMILAFVDGEYAGNCSFHGLSDRRRTKHRAGIGIALYLKFTGFGLGRLLLQGLLQIVREQGYEQAELIVVSDNARAIHLYESLGFRECGRIPRASKYADGTYSDDVLMVLPLE